VAALHQARHEIAEVAARWEADGAVDTSPLVGPLLRIQQALSELEPTGRRKSNGRTRPQTRRKTALTVREKAPHPRLPG